MDIFVIYNNTPVNTKNESIDRLIDWLIDWIEFYAVSAIFQPCNGGKTESTLHRLLNNNLYLTCTCTLYMKGASSSCDVTNTFRITVFQLFVLNIIWSDILIYLTYCTGVLRFTKITVLAIMIPLLITTNDETKWLISITMTTNDEPLDLDFDHYWYVFWVLLLMGCWIVR